MEVVSTQSISHHEYKQMVEARIAGNVGSTHVEVLLQCITAVAAAMLSQDTARLALAYVPSSVGLVLARSVEFVFLFGPSLACMTTATQGDTEFIAVATLIVFAISRLTSRICSKRSLFNVRELSSTSRPPFVTIYRASLMVMTCLAILCVDFLIFPVRFIKTESFGISLMDIGVGQFVFSAAVAFGGKLAASAQHRAARFSRKFLGSTIPLVLFGGLRCYMVYMAEYQEHVSEYGKHWNFFITLACLPVLYVIVDAIGKSIPFFSGRIDVPGFSSVIVLILHQVFLSSLGGTDYVESPHRRSLIEANKEGIVSLPGYLAIFLAGVDCGWMLFRGRSTRKRVHHLRAGLTCLAMAVVLYGIALCVDSTIQRTSRKLCNAAYATLVAALSLVALGALYLLDVAAARRDDQPTPSIKSQRPSTILECINENQFPLFLVANLSTGVVNLSMRTIFQPSTVAFAVMVLYALWLSTVALFWHETMQWRLKFW